MAGGEGEMGRRRGEERLCGGCCKRWCSGGVSGERRWVKTAGKWVWRSVKREGWWGVRCEETGSHHHTMTEREADLLDPEVRDDTIKHMTEYGPTLSHTTQPGHNKAYTFHPPMWGCTSN